jgi:enterochelin esterase-like enzyme
MFLAALMRGSLHYKMAVLLGLLVTCQNLAAAPLNEAEEIGSPRLAALADQVRAGNGRALAEFWKELDGKAPLVEPIEGQPARRRVTFIWRGSNDTTRVTMIRGLPDANLLKPLNRLANTDLWYRTELHSTEARFQYVFQIDGPEKLPLEFAAMMKWLEKNPPRPDPLNKNRYAGSSYIELPDAPPQPWIQKQAGVPSGSKIEAKIESQILKAEYSLSVYTPAGYGNEGRRCWLMIAFDGSSSARNVTLDNLLAAGKIPPIVVVGIKNNSPASRERDLDCSDEFASFLAKELTPWARKTYRVYKDPAHTIIGGSSLGGKMAAYSGLKHSEVFGKVLSQSGSFFGGARQSSPTPLWEGEVPGLLAVQFAQSPRLPLEFYLEAGRYETTLAFSPLLEARRLRDVLRAKGYPVTYSEFVGDHNEVCWRGSFAGAIIALTGKWGK